MKLDFETVVRDNTDWPFGYVKSRLKSTAQTEDVVQEIWLRVFRAYPSYYEEGRLRSWLMRIAQNTLRSYYTQSARTYWVSLDADSEEEDSLYAYLSAGKTPEEEYLQKELIAEVMRAVSALPEYQRQVITYRFFEGLSVKETAQRMGIPTGSVKSRSHYAVDRLRRQMAGDTRSTKGECTMNCKDAQPYLFVYAMGNVSAVIRTELEDHLCGCPACAGVAAALQALIPTMTHAHDDEIGHFLVVFPQQRISYCGVSSFFPNAEEMNACLQERGGIPPEDTDWLGFGSGKDVRLTGLFDNDGNEISFGIKDVNPTHYRFYATHIPRMYERMWIYGSYHHESDYANEIQRSEDTPNLFHGRLGNHFGGAVKSALYLALPKEAKHIRIKRGNGVIDGETYWFPYVDRYVAAEEPIVMECTFLMDL